VSLPWTGAGRGVARAYIRSHDLLLRREPGEGPQLAVTVAHVRRVGVAAHVLLSSSTHGELTAELPFHELSQLGIERGAQLVAHIRSARIFTSETPS